MREHVEVGEHVPHVQVDEAEREACERHERENRPHVAREMVHNYARDALTSWREKRDGRQCPRQLAELAPYMNDDTVVDPWGTPYAMSCLHIGILVVSAGPDGIFFTRDDIRSDSPYGGGMLP